MPTAGYWEPDEPRGSRPVLRERGGETPPRHSPSVLLKAFASCSVPHCGKGTSHTCLRDGRFAKRPRTKTSIGLNRCAVCGTAGAVVHR